MKYDLAIIGGGPAGYTAAERAAAGGLSTILFEKNALGGVCLNEGCIPTKTFLYSAKLLDNAKSAVKYGVLVDNPSVDLAKIVARKTKVVKKLTAGIRMKMNEHGVEVINGTAHVKRVEEDAIYILCNETMYEAGKLLLCTGSESFIPPVPGLQDSSFWTSREALLNKEKPSSLLIIGGGVIGMEFASFFNSIGTEVYVVEMMDEILTGMDSELAAQLRAEYTKKGVRFYLKHRVVKVAGDEVEIENEDGNITLIPERILVSVGRKPVTSGFGIQELGLEMFRNGVKVNGNMQTTNPLIYACGDITGFSLLAHTAVKEAEVAVDHILGKNVPEMSYQAIPGVVYTNPEIAGIGKTEEELKAAGIEYHVRKGPMAFSGRFVAENELGNGICKLILGSDNTLLGAHLLGNPVSELIIIAGIAIEKGLSLEELQSFVFPHPTVGEIFKEIH